jgi:hypothetical protein
MKYYEVHAREIVNRVYKVQAGTGEEAQRKVVEDADYVRMHDSDAHIDEVLVVKALPEEFACDLCPRVFKDRDAFINHISEHDR